MLHEFNGNLFEKAGELLILRKAVVCLHLQLFLLVLESIKVVEFLLELRVVKVKLLNRLIGFFDSFVKLLDLLLVVFRLTLILVGYIGLFRMQRLYNGFKITYFCVCFIIR